MKGYEMSVVEGVNKNKIVYSVVIPMHNEEGVIEGLLKSITSVMDGIGSSYEIIVVNDGSTDATEEKLIGIQKINERVIPACFSARRGQTAALQEGFRLAKGDIVISMDGDFQDNPEEIPSMLDMFREKQVDALCGWRRNRNDDARTIMISRIGNFLQRLLLNVPIHDVSCTFRVYKKEAIKAIQLNKEGFHRFIPVILKRAGFSLAEKEVAHNPRKHGESKYTLKKAPETVRLFFDILRSSRSSLVSRRSRDEVE